MSKAAVVFILFVIYIDNIISASICASSDPVSECNALIDFGNALNWEYWVKNTHWMSDKTICDWHGLTCDSKNHITEIELTNNNLTGYIPKSIYNLTELESFDIHSSRPIDYRGCNGTNLQNSSLPETFYNLTKLTDINIEYVCLSGIISDNIANLKNLVSLQNHGNYIYGTIPMALDKCTNLEILKLGRNPINGTIPAFKNLHKLGKFNCNFCALTGTFPDIFGSMPDLYQSFWDGNGLTGSIPESIGSLKHLKNVSFNINQMSGTIPQGLCTVMDANYPPLFYENGTRVSDNLPNEPCRIGADTNYTLYQGDYPWIIPVTGNMYSCPLPNCTVNHAVCDPDNSIVKCQ
eukprot:249600_1